MNYLAKITDFDCGFQFDTVKLLKAIKLGNEELRQLPFKLWETLDLKNAGSVVGSYFCSAIAEVASCIVNPVEHGSPDLLPVGAVGDDKLLRKYPVGLELKGTLGNLPNGMKLKAGQTRVDYLKGINWKAHHRETKNLCAFVWDFLPHPTITAVFYSNNLDVVDWGNISGLDGRSTKLSNMNASGRDKLAKGIVCIIKDQRHVKKYVSLLGIKTQ
jgi:hypothetical protein